MTTHFWNGFEKRAAMTRVAGVINKAKDIAKNVVEHAIDYSKHAPPPKVKPWQAKMMAKGKTPVGITQAQMPRKLPTQPLEPLAEKPWPGEGIKGST